MYQSFPSYWQKGSEGFSYLFESLQVIENADKSAGQVLWEKFLV